MYEESKDKILNRMLNNVDNEVNKGEGTYTYDALSIYANETEKTRIQVETILSKVFIQNAVKNGYEDEVVARAEELGVYRKNGIRATTKITIQGIEGTIIPKDFLVQTELGLQFKTLYESRIPKEKTIDIEVEALEEGTKYNISENKIIKTPVQLVGILKVYNLNAVENGRDIETIESLYDRYLLKISTPSTSGNIYDYMNWCMEINGVGNCIIKSLWDGPGTVKAILVDTNGSCPSSEIINNVKINIENKRPIGATVTVVGVEEVNLNIEVILILEKDSSIEDTKEEIIKNLERYLKTISLKSNIVRYNKISNCILNVLNVVDFKELKINNTETDIILNDDSIAVLESVVVRNV